MIYTLPIAEVLHKEILLEDNFISNFEGWEIVDNEDEKSFIKDSYYWMENKNNSRWMFYNKKLPIKRGENFIINAEIELINDNGYGQYGLVWGFDKPHDILNRFTVSVESNRFSVCKFDKNYRNVFHRHAGNFDKELDSKNKQYFSIMRLDQYYYFFLHHFDRPAYICHKSQLQMEGFRFGFYVEPGIFIRCDKITVKRLITNKEFDGRIWMPVNEDFSPLGYDTLNGN